MISEAGLMKKLRDEAAVFVKLHQSKNYGAAHNVYMRAHNVAVMAELSEKQLKELFGDWDSDDGTGTETAKDNGLFQRWRVEEVNWKCCIKTNQTYDAAVMRRTGREPLHFYGDLDYCAQCKEQKKKSRPTWDDSMLE